MKTTLEIPDPLFRKAKATAALRGQSLKELINAAIEKEIASPATAAKSVPLEKWYQEYERLGKELHRLMQA